MRTRTSSRNSRVIYRLLDSNGESLGAKQILMNVCDGYFMKSEINREHKWNTGFRG